MLNSNDNTNHERKFHVYKRETSGFVHKVGVLMADNKVQADTKVRFMYARSLEPGVTVWAVDPELEALAG